MSDKNKSLSIMHVENHTSVINTIKYLFSGGAGGEGRFHQMPLLKMSLFYVLTRRYSLLRGLTSSYC